jgi:hypothetical protein
LGLGFSRTRQRRAATRAANRQNGVEYERENIQSISDAENLRGSLQTLQQRYRIDFRADISLLDDKIGELAEEKELKEGTAFSQAEIEEAADLIDDNSIRGMFATLVA